MHWPEARSDSWHLLTNKDTYFRIRAMEQLREDAMGGFAPSIPAAGGFIDGIPVDNIRGSVENVVKATHARRLHFGKQLELKMAANPSLTFFDAFPDTRPGSCGSERLYPNTFRAMKHQLPHCVRDEASLVKHILQKHAGEARLVGDPWWEGLRPWHCHRKPGFWHYQFMPNEESRAYLLRRNAGSRRWDDLDDYEIDEIMRLVSDKTLVLKREWNHKSRCWDWRLIQGKYITLGEWFWFGSHKLSCFDLYHMYISLPRFIEKRQASGKTPGAARPQRQMAASQGDWQLEAKKAKMKWHGWRWPL